MPFDKPEFHIYIQQVRVDGVYIFSISIVKHFAVIVAHHPVVKVIFSADPDTPGADIERGVGQVVPDRIKGDVKPLNITALKPANADLKIHGTISKIFYNGHMMLSLEKPLSLNLKKPVKTDSVFITGKEK